MDSIYLDNAATTKVRHEVREAFFEALERTFGNASSVHSAGQEAKKLLEESRERAASCIGAPAGDLIFTSGGTESDNFAVMGAGRVCRDKGAHIITSGIEHPAVLNACEALETEGFEVSYVPADSECIVDPERVREAMRPETVLVSVMLANNETGAIEPISEISAIAHEAGALFHTDAIQAAGKIPVNVDDLGVDLLSLSGHKIYGPKGVGALYVRSGTKLLPLLKGGHHEKSLRPGTENVPGIAAFATALELAVGELPGSAERLRALKEILASGICASIPAVRRNGSEEKSLPNILNMSFEGVDGESILLNLDLMGIAVSTGSACASGTIGPSHVLLAMGIAPRVAQSSVRFSFGRDNTEAEVKRVLELLPEVVARLRDLSTATVDK
ncbi:MAG: cysteine desulfurase NifS [Candidatus Anoxymicrobium japonicum]|uniref:cysteine desulfurase n=1 Tax=Candidatus Anoxymicrobium japonicum TaxID=2013648 RepID=A0A2N3G5A7_9ACTN|nr:MAG: cysteine desulfurase NifS [Candidatus Anoxymicrobium japonicum]